MAHGMWGKITPIGLARTESQDNLKYTGEYFWKGMDPHVGFEFGYHHTQWLDAH